MVTSVTDRRGRAPGTGASAFMSSATWSHRSTGHPGERRSVVVVGLNASAAAARALTFATQVQAPAGRIICLYSEFQPPPDLCDHLVDVGGFALTRELVAQERELVQHLVDGLRSTVSSVELRCSLEPPARALERLADKVLAAHVVVGAPSSPRWWRRTVPRQLAARAHPWVVTVVP